MDDYERPSPADDMALVVDAADSSLAEDRDYAVDLYGPAGIPVCWIVNVKGRRVEVYTGPGPQNMAPTKIFAEGKSVPIIIPGRVVGRIAVKDLLPPRHRGRRPRATEPDHPQGQERGQDRTRTSFNHPDGWANREYALVPGSLRGWESQDRPPESPIRSDPAPTRPSRAREAARAAPGRAGSPWHPARPGPSGGPSVPDRRSRACIVWPAPGDSEWWGYQG